MKILLNLLLVVILLIEVNSAPKNNKNLYNKDNPNKKCPQCRIKGNSHLNPICGVLGNNEEETYDSEAIFSCFAKCRRVESEILHEGACKPRNLDVPIPTLPPQTREQCIAACDRTALQKGAPACEGHGDLTNLQTYRYETVLDCYITCPENTLSKLHLGPCIQDRYDPLYKKYIILAPYSICYNKTTKVCIETRKARLGDEYSLYPLPGDPSLNA